MSNANDWAENGNTPTREEALAYKESLGVIRTREEAESIANEEG